MFAAVERRARDADAAVDGAAAKPSRGEGTLNIEARSLNNHPYYCCRFLVVYLYSRGTSNRLQHDIGIMAISR